MAEYGVKQSPAGNYTDSIMAAAVKPDKHHVPVSIKSNGTHSLEFSLTPDGMIYGHVSAAQNAEDRPAGMPAEQLLATRPGAEHTNGYLKGRRH